MTSKWYKNKEEVLVLILIVGALIWSNVVEPIIAWTQRNSFLAILVGLALAVVLWKAVRYYFELKKQKDEEERAFEEEQHAKGLEKFVDRRGIVSWNSPEKNAERRRADREAQRKKELVNRVIAAVNAYHPPKPGPTDTRALETISDKAMRYGQHFKHLIVVLFETQFNEGRYEEWLDGMKQNYPKVVVIRKD